MKRTNINKTTSEELRRIYSLTFWAEDKKPSLFTGKMEALKYEIDKELSRRCYSAIYKTACRVINNKGMNQFAAAKRYTDSVINGCDWFSTDTSHEIGSYYTKSRCPVIVDF